MRTIFSGIMVVYFVLGQLFGVLCLVSYPWGLITHVQCFTGAGFVSFFVVFVSTMALAAFGMLVRIILWLPSLIHWWIVGGEPTFLSWLMPGLSIGCG